MTEMILKIAALITAISSIVLFFIKVYKFIRKIDKKIDYFSDSLEQNTLSTLRLVINDENMPLDERVNAGEEYVKRGGNGSIHVKYEYLKEQYKKELEKEV